MKFLRTLQFVAVWLGGLWVACGAQAAIVDISPTPLATGAASQVKPNLMFVMDDSGSMDWDYLPDWAGQELVCRSAGATPTGIGAFARGCCQDNGNNGRAGNTCFAGAAPFGQWRGHPPYLSSDFNGVAYNPAVRYRPPVFADGSPWNSQTAANTANWTSVRNDAYNVQNTQSIDLTTQFPDAEWCTDTSYTDCLRNGNYVLPGTVNGKTYATHRATTATGTGLIAVGAPDAATTQSRSFGPHYYRIVPFEFCDAPNLRNCQASQTDVFKHPAPLRWCNTAQNASAVTPEANSCQAVRTSTYREARFPTKVLTPGVEAVPGTPERPASVTFTVSTSGTCNNNNSNNRVSVAFVRAGSVDLLTGSTTAATNGAGVAAAIAAGIEAARTSNGGFRATSSNAAVTITAPASAGAMTSAVTLARVPGGNCAIAINPTTPRFAGYAAATPGTPAVPGGFPGSFVRVDIVPSINSYPKASGRSDCAGSTCTYAEEMTNFANWWTYYRTRMQSMKTSASLAFAPLSDQFRVGWLSINNSTGSDFLNPDTFSGGHKSDWFNELRAARPGGTTPLRTALARVGRLYAGQLNNLTLNGSRVVDPMQFSCQQNFTLLSTDGYWNETSTPRQINGTTAIGDQNGSDPRPFLDGSATANTLADVAAYYYKTDLRTPALNNCTGAGGGDVCENNVPVGGADTARYQHMTTFTLGLGTSGFMQFSSDYRTASSGDFFAVANGSTVNLAAGICTWQASGTCNWPVPVSGSQTTIDDLWHAAVSGRGAYFSAGNPADLFTGLRSALAELEQKVGAAAAATTSNPNVSSGDNFVFISNYTSVEWSGELLGRQLSLSDGTVQSNLASDWSAREKLDANTARRVLMFDGSNASTRLKNFDWASLTSSERAFFQTPHITAAGRSLSQFCNVGFCLTPAAQASAPGEPLVNFLRGDRSNEGPESDTGKFFRQRNHLLGDIVNSEAVYVRQAMFRYADAGYAAFKASTATRQPMVYVGANDGMLHAFDATTGDEKWAYVPTAVLPNLYRLADKAYATRHQFYVDSTPTQGDVKIGTEWRTLLVGGLGAGGRAYYALDVTDPDNPKALWEFTDPQLGLTYGRPEIAKLANGTWVVLLPSGYNNVSPGNGAGVLFVLDAATGTEIRRISTGAGSASAPSGLAQIRAWVDNAEVDNTALRVYGGDNLGNVWRFDINDTIGTPGFDAQLLATLAGPGGTLQPVTARPELGLVDGKPMVYVGTGRYLGTSDLTDARRQSIYAIKDRLTAESWGSPRMETGFVQQFLTDDACPANSTACTAGESIRRGTSNTVNLATAHGWFVDLPATGERANNEPQLALGTLVVTTNIVNASACTAGGTSYINFFDYRTGGPISTANGVVSVFLGNALSTRPTVIRLPSGKIVSVTRLFDDRTIVRQVPVPPTASTTRRLSWRELVTE